jgi:hypothetical protein
MRVSGLNWVGTRITAFNRAKEFFQRRLNLGSGARREYFARLDLPNFSSMEVLDAAGGEYAHFSTAPVPGFHVSEFDQARSQLGERGVEVLGPVGEIPQLLGAGGRDP